MKRVASIYLPMWSIDLVRRRRERADIRKSQNRQITRSPDPILIIALERGVQVVKYCCEQAMRFGITPAMTLAHARALITTDQCIVEEDDPQRDLQSLHKLAMWAQRYSPIVAPDPPDGLLIDISGCQRFFHGEEKLAEIIASDLNRLRFHAQVAIASTFACASAVARSAMEPRMNADEHGFNKKGNTQPKEQANLFFPESCSPPSDNSSAFIRVHPRFLSVVAHGDERSALSSLPLETMRLEAQTIAALHEIEIVRIGQLFDLPRDQVADRFGHELLLRLDQATGHGAIEAIEPVRLKHPPRVEHVFDGPVLQLEGVMLMTHSLVEQLCAQLLKLERGVCRLDAEFVRIDAPPIRLAVRLSHPSRSVKHIWSLLRPKVESINLGFGIEEIALAASRSQILPHEQLEPQINADTRGNNSLSASACGDLRFHSQLTGEFIDTLANRLGNDRVLRCELFESHVPERSFRMRSALESDHPRQSKVQNRESTVDLDRPTILLSQPESISVSLEGGLPHRVAWHEMETFLTECIGTEAIASEWWKESPSGLREYYKVQSESGLWLWMYYQHATDQWFIHGVWG